MSAPLFSGSYIAFCLELRLERKFEDGDWFWWPGDDHFPEGVYCQNQAAQFEHDIPQVTLPGDEQTDPYGEQPNPLAVWLSRLDQWMSMLEEAGYLSVWFYPEEDTGLWRVETMWSKERRRAYPRPEFDEVWGEGPTREEAAARLWMAVTGQRGAQ